MKNLDAVPHFVDSGDDQDTLLELPIFVTRQIDDATRLGARKRLLTAVAEEANHHPVERLIYVKKTP